MADVKKYASINDLDEAVDCILSAKSIIGPFKGLSEISTQTQNALDSLNDAWNYVENMKEGLGDYTASTKKSTSQPKSFGDMVAKQRAKNNNIQKRSGLTLKDGMSVDDVAELTREVNDLNEKTTSVRDKALEIFDGPSNTLTALNDVLGDYFVALEELRYTLATMQNPYFKE